MKQEDIIRMAREAGFVLYDDYAESMKSSIEHFAALVRADERMSFYGQDKPAECADGCPPNQICDYCQVVAPAKAMILAEREACAKVCKKHADVYAGLEQNPATQSAWAACIDNHDFIRARGNT